MLHLVKFTVSKNNNAVANVTTALDNYDSTWSRVPLDARSTAYHTSQGNSDRNASVAVDLLAQQTRHWPVYLFRPRCSGPNTGRPINSRLTIDRCLRPLGDDSRKNEHVTLIIITITSCASGDTICLCPCKLTISSYLFARWHLFWRHVGYLGHQQQLDLWPFDLESGVWVTCDVGYLCANFSLPRPLCSPVRPDVRDRQTDVRQTSDKSIA